MPHRCACSLPVLTVTLLLPLTGRAAEEPSPSTWRRHTIDDSSRGADGVRLADVNGDGRPDITTGWEEGGVIRTYLHPGHDSAKKPWPAVTVGKVRSAEDAVFVDLDGDGATDVVSCCEGNTRAVYVHWAPTDPEQYLKEAAWKTEPLPASQGLARWMFCLPMQVDGRRGTDLVVGAKNPGAAVGWFESPEDPRDLSAWKWHPLTPAGWIMSIVAEDIDGDGDSDLVISDRKGKIRGVRWLENPGAAVNAKSPGEWKSHEVGGQGQEVMFLSAVDVNDDQREDYICAVRGGGLLVLQRTAAKTPQWEASTIPMPAKTGTGKGAHAADLDGDGNLDVVFSCENSPNLHGVMWLRGRPSGGGAEPVWQPHPISGAEQGAGIKFDLVELVDLDGDGDLDVLTCEERDNLGVIWYENPSR